MKYNYRLSTPVYQVFLYLFAAVMIFTGCTTVKPAFVGVDQMEYGQVIAESWKRQTLLNIVRMRYADAPVFLEVTGVINSQSLGGTANTGLSFPGGSPPVNLSAEQTWSNTPTISYAPLMGERFTKSLLQPFPPIAIFQLIQGGWPAELVLGSTVSSLNGLRNSHVGIAADSAYREVVKLFSNIQIEGGLGFRVEARGDSNSVIVVLPDGAEDSSLTAERRRIRELLNLSDDISEFKIAYGLTPKDKHEVAIISRSMLELLLQLGFGIDLPPSDVADGRVLKGHGKPGMRQPNALLFIHSGLKSPEDAFVSAQYKKNYFWIEDTDLPSKRMFTFMMILFSLAETGQTFTGPIVTVPSR